MNSRRRGRATRLKRPGSCVVGPRCTVMPVSCLYLCVDLSVSILLQNDRNTPRKKRGCESPLVYDLVMGAQRSVMKQFGDINVKRRASKKVVDIIWESRWRSVSWVGSCATTRCCLQLFISKARDASLRTCKLSDAPSTLLMAFST